MEMNLENQTALVTGSTKGIGRSIAEELAKEGVNVIINGRHSDTVEDVVSQLKKSYPSTSPKAALFDLRKQEDLNALFKEFPKINILINSMGIFKPTDYYDIDDEKWIEFFKNNVLTGNALAQFYLPKMIDENAGRIIFISSEEGIMPSGEMAHYSMTKSMQLSLSKSLSKLTKGTNVTVNTIMPGSTLTEGVNDMLDDIYQDTDMNIEEKEKDFMENNRPLSQIQRLIRPEEIGRLAVFISSPKATGFSGQAIRMDGGLVPTIF